MANRFAALDVEEEDRPKVGADKKVAAVAPKKAAAPAAAVAPKAAAAKSTPAGGEEDAEGAAARARRAGAPPSGGGRGAERTRDGWNGRGRQFDRHSGTGRGKEVAKGGSGGHNWGAPKDDAKLAEGEVVPATGETPVEGEAAAAAAPAAVVEEDDGFVTLDVIEKERASKREGALFTNVKADTSHLLDQFKGSKKVVDVDEDDLKLFGGKFHGKKAEVASPAAGEAAEAGDKSALWGFKFGPTSGDAPRGERPARGRGGAPRGAPRERREGGGERREGGFERREGGAPREGGERREGGAPREGGFERREGGERRDDGAGRGRGGGRGRGAPRGGRGGEHSGPRRDAPAAAAPRSSGRVDVNDAAAFPALS